MVMDEEVRQEFGRLEDRIGGAARWAIGLGLAIAVPVLSGALVVYSQVHQAVAKNGEQDVAIHRSQETREKVVEIETRIKAIEGNVGEVKDEQKEQRRILENIERQVSK